MADIDFPFCLGTFASEAREEFPGLVIGERVYPISSLFRTASIPLSECRIMLEVLEHWDKYLPGLISAAEYLKVEPGSAALRMSELKIKAPVRPRQIICAGANYRKHVIDLMVDHPGAGGDASLPAAERRQQAGRMMDHRAANGQPFCFIKPYSTLLDPYADFIIPADSIEADWELELAVVIGKPARRVSRNGALEHVAGYTIANDISARDHLRRPDFPAIGMDWVACKGGPGFLPIGPVIVPAMFIPKPQQLRLELRLNGDVMQNESTADMIFPVAHLIEFISTYMQLLPGDIICTGSPSGNGTHYNRYLRPGDVIEGRIEGLGMQHNVCVAETLAADAVMHSPFVPLSPL